MAALSRWTMFVRVFLVTLLVGTGGRSVADNVGERDAWKTANTIGTVAAFYAFLSRYPAGSYADDAVEKLVALGAMKSTKATRQLPNIGKSKSPASTRSTDRDRESDRSERSSEADPY